MVGVFIGARNAQAKAQAQAAAQAQAESDAKQTPLLPYMGATFADQWTHGPGGWIWRQATLPRDYEKVDPNQHIGRGPPHWVPDQPVLSEAEWQKDYARPDITYDPKTMTKARAETLRDRSDADAARQQLIDNRNSGLLTVLGGGLATVGAAVADPTNLFTLDGGVILDVGEAAIRKAVGEMIEHYEALKPLAEGAITYGSMAMDAVKKRVATLSPKAQALIKKGTDFGSEVMHDTLADQIAGVPNDVLEWMARDPQDSGDQHSSIAHDVTAQIASAVAGTLLKKILSKGWAGEEDEEASEKAPVPAANGEPATAAPASPARAAPAPAATEPASSAETSSLPALVGQVGTAVKNSVEGTVSDSLSDQAGNAVADGVDWLTNLMSGGNTPPSQLPPTATPGTPPPAPPLPASPPLAAPPSRGRFVR